MNARERYFSQKAKHKYKKLKKEQTPQLPPNLRRRTETETKVDDTTSKPVT